MQSLEELIAQANDNGLEVNNLCQVRYGYWRANLRTPPPAMDDERPQWFHEFGVGKTANEALYKALVNATLSRHKMKPEPIKRSEPDPLADEIDPLADDADFDPLAD